MFDTDTAWNELLRGLRRAGGFSQGQWSGLISAAARPGSAAAASTDSIGRWERRYHVPNAATVDAICAVCTEQGLFTTVGVDEHVLRTKLAHAHLTLRAVRAVEQLGGERRDGVQETRGAQPSSNPWAHRHNLPFELTSFIGREGALAELRRLLQTAHLVTVTGPPGVGKSRLALRAAAESIDSFVDGVWLVELGSLTDSSLVAPAIASALRVGEQPQQLLPVTLAAALDGRQMLLVLDTCEHLIAACADIIATLLRSCSDLRVLATSQQPLRVPGEVVWPLPPLQVPTLADLPSTEEVASSEAIRLFVERASAANPSFGLSERNVGAVIHVCRQLDGIPLSIELAAARVTVLGVEQIAVRLQDRFALLTGGSQTGVSRHATLRAAVDWSYGLLTENERRLLRRLVVFVGTFTLEAAEKVIAGDDLESSAILDLLSGLVAKSLVVVEERGGRMRYRLLDTLRQYAEERLKETDEQVAVRRRHLAWYTALAEEGEPQFWGPRQPHWLAQLEVEYANLRAALEWSQHDAPDGPGLGLRLAAAMWFYWDMRGYLSEGRDLLERLLALALEPTPARAQVLIEVSRLAFFQGDAPSSLTCLTEARRLAEETGYHPGLHHALCGLGVLARQAGDLDEARALFELALLGARRTGDWVGAANALLMKGELNGELGEREDAAALLIEALAIARDHNALWIAAWSLFDLGHLALGHSEYGRAWELLEESLRLRWEVGDTFLATLSLDGLAWTAAAQEDFERAAWLLAAAEAVRGRIGGQLWPQYGPDHDSAVEATCSVLGDARLAAVREEVRALSIDQTVAQAIGDRSLSVTL